MRGSGYSKGIGAGLWVGPEHWIEILVTQTRKALDEIDKFTTELIEILSDIDKLVAEEGDFR